MSSAVMYITSTLIGIAGISLTVLVHETGHMIAGIACGINVEYLQIGFGKKLFEFSVLGICIRFCLFPVGGLCRFTGENDMRYAIITGKRYFDSCEDGSLYAVSPVKRIITFLCGPLANILFCVVCYFILALIPVVIVSSPPEIVLLSSYPTLYENKDYPASRCGLETGDTVLSVNGTDVSCFDDIAGLLKQCSEEHCNAVLQTQRGFFTMEYSDSEWGLAPFIECVVSDVDKSSPEYESGLRKNDRIISVNGNKCTNMTDLIAVLKKECSQLTFVVEREHSLINISFIPRNNEFAFSLGCLEIRKNGKGFKSAFKASILMCINDIKNCIDGINSALHGKRLSSFNGIIGASNKMGIMTLSSFSQSLNKGIRTVITLIGMTCVSIGVVNMLPIPCMDGGMILVNILELILKRHLSPAVHMALQTAGLLTVGIVIVLINLF